MTTPSPRTTSVSSVSPRGFARRPWVPLAIALLLAFALVFISVRNKLGVEDTARRARRGRAVDLALQAHQAMFNVGFVRNKEELRVALGNLVHGPVQSMILLDDQGRTVLAAPSDDVSPRVRAAVARMRAQGSRRLVRYLREGPHPIFEIVFAFKPRAPKHKVKRITELIKQLRPEEREKMRPGPLGPAQQIYLRVVVTVHDDASVRAIRRARNAHVVSWIVAVLLVLLSIGAFFAERRMNRMRRALEAQRALAEMGEMAAVLAHEIRNPLGVIKGRAQVLLEDDEKPTREALQGLVDQSGRLERLVNELLEFARPAPPQVRSVAGEELVAQALDAVAELAVERQVAIVPDAGPGELRADADQIQRALVNLLRNALEATPEGGRVTLRFESSRGTARFTVVDDGPGLSPELGAEIFKPFVTSRQRGSGLGLAVVRRIAEAHGGSVEGTNTADRGASFLLSLPVEGPHA